MNTETKHTLITCFSSLITYLGEARRTEKEPVKKCMLEAAYRDILEAYEYFLKAELAENLSSPTESQESACVDPKRQ